MEQVTRKERTRRIVQIVVSLVLMLAGFGFGIYAMNKRDDLQAPIANQRKANRGQLEAVTALQEELLRFSEPVGFRSEQDVLMPEAVPRPIDDGVIRFYLNRWRARLAEQHGVTGYKEWGVGDPNSCLDVRELFDEIRKVRKDAQAKEGVFNKESGANDPAWKFEPGSAVEIKIPPGTRSEEAGKLSTEAAEAQKAADEVVRKLRADHVNAVTVRNSRLKEINEQRKVLEAERNKVCTETAALKIANSQEKEKALLEKKDLKERLDWIELVKQEALERQEADGRIIHSDAPHGVVYIDIKEKDGLFKGTKFKVFSLQKAGAKKIKGEVQVFDVLTDYSRCIILKTLDPQDPLDKDDYVFDEFYDRERTLLFAFAGRFIGPHINAEMETKLQAYRRYRHSPKMTREVNYLVAGEGYDATPAYVEAIKYGTKIIREKDFYAFLGLTY